MSRHGLALLLLACAPAVAGAADCTAPTPPAATLWLDLDGDGVIDPARGERILSYAVSAATLTASDVSDPAHPAQLWRISPGGDFAELAPQWSTPRIATVNLAESGARPRIAVILGGGYGEGRGAALFVVRADSGKLIWQGRHPALRAGIAAAPALLDSDGDGAVDRLVVGDTSGQVWRADLSGGVAAWKLSRLATLPGRFFNTPDLLQARDASGRYDAVILGSGDREHPLGAASQDSLFLLKDRALAPGSGVDRDEPLEGWRLALPAGEKVLSSPLTVANTVYLSTFIPPPEPASACDQGRGYVRAVRLGDGTPGAGFALDTPGVEPSRVELHEHGIPPPVIHAGAHRQAADASCRSRLSVGAQDFDAPGCGHFRTFWQKVGG